MDNDKKMRYERAQQRIMSPQEAEQRKKLLDKSVRTQKDSGQKKKGTAQKKKKVRSEQERKALRDKRNNRLGFIDVVNVICFMTILFLSTHMLFTTQQIKVTNNELITENEVLVWLSEDELTVNAIYTWAKYNFFTVEYPVAVESVDIQFMKPWFLNVKVKEKSLVGGVLVGQEYVYYDKEGIVLLKSLEQKDEITVFEGISVDSVEIHQKLPVADIEVFEKMVELSIALEEEGLIPDEIKHEGNDVIASVSGVEILFGTENYGVKVQQLEPILEELEGKEGILNLKNYQSKGDMITFQ